MINRRVCIIFSCQKIMGLRGKYFDWCVFWLSMRDEINELFLIFTSSLSKNNSYLMCVNVWCVKTLINTITLPPSRKHNLKAPLSTFFLVHFFVAKGMENRHQGERTWCLFALLILYDVHISFLFDGRSL